MVRTGLAAMLAVMAMMSGAAAQGMQPNVAVPAPGGGGGTRAYEGCYRIKEQLYGPYRMTFCLGRQQGYTVRGGGLDCQGDLDWDRRNPTRIQINLEPSRCGRGTDWTADVIRCSFIDDGRGGGRGSGGVNAQVAVPAPAGRDLSCRYIPKAQGFQPMQVTANRQR